jgi:hypothetical protein
MKHDPSGTYPVVCNQPAYFRTYFWMFKDYRLIMNQKFIEPEKELVDVSAIDGFWFLDAHDMKGMFPELEEIVTQYFEQVDSARFKRASVMFFRFKSVHAKVELIDGIPIPVDGKLCLSRFANTFGRN